MKFDIASHYEFAVGLPNVAQTVALKDQIILPVSIPKC